jgi:NAD(P)-dependent dehydrogenase (short-subunit alcohol dehydrogenase family)
MNDPTGANSVVTSIHDADADLVELVRKLAPPTGEVVVIDVSGASWLDSVETLSRDLLAHLASTSDAGSTTFVVRTPSRENAVSESALAAVKGTVGVAALEAAPTGRRVNVVLVSSTTTDRDLGEVLAYLANDEAAGFTAGATIDLRLTRTVERVTDEQLPILVTGAAGGLGGAVAEAFVAAGRRVVISDLASDALATRAERLGVTAIACDVTSSDDVAALAAHPALAGGISSLQVLHGVGGAGALNDLDDGVRERSLRINGTGVWNVVDALLPAVGVANGSVVVLSSQAGLIAEPGNGAYCAAKFAAVGLVRALANHGPANVRVHTLCPGPIDTPLMRNAFAGMAEAAGVTYDEYHAQRLSMIPLGRFGKPEHMGAAALVLSELNATGVTLAPTGAFLLT